MFWWGLVIVEYLHSFPSYMDGLLRWASSDEGIDRELSKEHFSS